MRTLRGAMLCLALLATPAAAQERQPGVVQVTVSSSDAPVEGAAIVIGTAHTVSDDAGRATVTVSPGRVAVSVTRTGFADARVEVDVVGGATVTVDVVLIAVPEHEEEVTVVATTRSGRRIEDDPTRVEVLDREEIEEKMLMTPGDISMLLNEMGGMRAQATAPSLGAASVRIQGMLGRYARIFSDGLPLFGQQTGGFGLMQIPPMDLGRVEVIKGGASALYGAGAVSGVINLISRQAAEEPYTDILLNQTTAGGTDGVVFAAGRLAHGWSATALAGGHWQSRRDRDDDGWTDIPGYDRVIARPRVSWSGDAGRNASLTFGYLDERRYGGTLPGRTLQGDATPYQERLATTRYDVGLAAQTLVHQRVVLTARGAVTSRTQRHEYGPTLERDQHDSVFAEVAARSAFGKHTIVAGAAFESDRHRPTDVPQFAYQYSIPGAFVQDDIDVTPWLGVSAGARLDVHERYGTFLSPRVAATARHGEWQSRVSFARGFFGPTPLTEETEAAGLTRLTIAPDLRAEQATTLSADLTRRYGIGSWTATLFTSRVADPVLVERTVAYVLSNQREATTTAGVDLLGTIRAEPFVVTGSYTFVSARQTDFGRREDVPLTPRHSAGLVAMVEDEEVGRLGLEVYYTGVQSLEADPFRTTSRPYVIVGMLGERRFGRLRLFVNAENIGDVRQTRWGTLVRPSPGADGRRTVDAWAPLDGRVINGGVRVTF